MGSLSGKAILGRAVDYFGNRRVFVIAEVAMALTLVFLIASNQFIIFVLISYVLGVFTKGTSPVIQTLISEAIHESHFEKAFGTSETLIQIAGATTIFVSGILADQFGITAVFYFSAILALLATFPIILNKSTAKN